MMIETKLLILAIAINIICLYKQAKAGYDKPTILRNTIITLGLGLILYFTIANHWYNSIPMTTTDPYGVTNNIQLGMIAISICPGLLITTIGTYIECKLIFKKYNKKEKH